MVLTAHINLLSGDEAHILDCQTGSDPGSVKGCRAVSVACDPGFPLTLRLHQAGAARLLGAGRAGRAGYPVIDTTDRMGLICSGATDSTAVNMICRNLGYKHVTILIAVTISSSTSHRFLGTEVACWILWTSVLLTAILRVRGCEVPGK